MDDAAAVKVAIDLFHVPSRVRFTRGEPLPPGILLVLQIAAGEERALAEVVEALGRPPQMVCDAARFFVEQILLSPDSNSYRVLGSESTATASELRRNMALLLRGLHPDIDRAGRSIYAGRVTAAWDDLKTPDRRAVYNRKRSLEENHEIADRLKRRRAWLRFRHDKPQGPLRAALSAMFRAMRG